LNDAQQDLNKTREKVIAVLQSLPGGLEYIKLAQDTQVMIKKYTETMKSIADLEKTKNIAESRLEIVNKHISYCEKKVQKLGDFPSNWKEDLDEYIDEREKLKVKLDKVNCSLKQFQEAKKEVVEKLHRLPGGKQYLKDKEQPLLRTLFRECVRSSEILQPKSLNELAM
jgi:chromosome segregation ATPase